MSNYGRGAGERRGGTDFVPPTSALRIRCSGASGTDFAPKFDYTSDALREIDAFFRKSGKVIVALTVREILEEEIAKKLA